MRLLWPATVLSFLLTALASITVIDDENGDPTDGSKIVYEPSNAWLGGTIAGCQQSCQYPPPNLATDGTFTGSFFNHTDNHKVQLPFNATVKFTGISVSVQCILSDSLSLPRGRTEMLFYVDGQLINSFKRDPTGSGEFLPNQTVFAIGSLPLGPHTLVIQNGAINGQPSLAILDSVLYSRDEDLSLLQSGSIATVSFASASASPTSSVSAVGAAKSSKAAPIVGAVVGVLALLLLLLLAFLYIRQRRRQHRTSNVPLSETMFSPFRDLWSAARGSSKPQPDMAPVPFPTPTQAVYPVPTPAPRARARPRTAPAAPSSGSQSRLSRISFNPNLLVGRLRRPPPITTQADPRIATASPPIPSGNPLLRQTSLPPENIASIQAWQQRTLQATAGHEPPVHPLDMSEVDISSHYDESTSSPPPAPPPPVAAPRSPQPQRRFTVMNN